MTDPIPLNTPLPPIDVSVLEKIEAFRKGRGTLGTLTKNIVGVAEEQFITPLDSPELARRTARVYFHRTWPFNSAGDLYNSFKGAGELAIIGSGPSLKNDLEEIRELNSLGTGVVTMTLNNAHEVLLDAGIKPDLALLVEPKDRAADYITPHPEVGYILGSQVADVTLEKFKTVAANTYIIHILQDKAHHEQCRRLNKKFKNRVIPIIGGATTAMSRGFDIALGLFHAYTIRFYACDSSGEIDGGMHAKPKPFGVTPCTKYFYLMHPDGKRRTKRLWPTTLTMARQAGEFWDQLKDRDAMTKSGHLGKFQIAFHGRGLLPDWAAFNGKHVNGPAIIEEIEKEGWVEITEEEARERDAATAEMSRKLQRKGLPGIHLGLDGLPEVNISQVYLPPNPRFEEDAP